MENNFKKIISDNIVIIAVLLFAVIFVIINYQQVVNGELTNTNIVKPILLSSIIILILLIISTWDDCNNGIYEQEQVIIPKYRLANINEFPNQNPTYNVRNGPVTGTNPPAFGLNSGNVNPFVEVLNLSGNSKFNIEAKPVENKLSNNIFVSQKNAGKYGIKF